MEFVSNIIAFYRVFSKNHFWDRILQVNAGVAEWQTHTTQNRARFPHEGSTPSSGTNYIQFKKDPFGPFLS